MSRKNKTDKTAPRSPVDRQSDQPDEPDFATLFRDATETQEKDTGFARLFEQTPIEKDLEQALREKQTSPQHTHRSGKKTQKNMQPQAEIDLHGYTGKEAESRTESFIHTAKGLGINVVLIITGKGLHSPGGAVLPDVVESKLRELKTRGLISGFSWEKKEKKRSGALLVFL
ncbi:Smr/MutS family protein [Thermodesulfobacteriota bacterium]